MMPTRERDDRVRRVVLIEGAANAAVLLLKLVVGFTTGSLAVLSDALHSLADVANNVLAWWIVRISGQPPDLEHPYGHRKFETLGVFALATLLTVLAFEVALGAFRRQTLEIATDPVSLGLMGTVLIVNIALSSWEARQARRLDSEILRADAHHTLADVLTTVLVIVAWQLAAQGHVWLDRVCAVGVAGLILYLAFGLFRRAIPVLVDGVALDPDAVAAVAAEVPGVRGVASIRSRAIGSEVAVDLVVRVDPELSTASSHSCGSGRGRAAIPSVRARRHGSHGARSR